MAGITLIITIYFFLGMFLLLKAIARLSVSLVTYLLIFLASLDYNIV